MNQQAQKNANFRVRLPLLLEFLTSVHNNTPNNIIVNQNHKLSRSFLFQHLFFSIDNTCRPN